MENGLMNLNNLCPLMSLIIFADENIEKIRRKEDVRGKRPVKEW